MDRGAERRGRPGQGRRRDLVARDRDEDDDFGDDAEDPAPRGRQRPLDRPSRGSDVVPARRRTPTRVATGRDAEFHIGNIVLDETPRSPIRWTIGGAIAALLICAVSWSYFGKFDSYTSADGKVQAAGRTKVVEALAVGKIQQILSRDGDAVKAGDTLVELDPTDALAARTILAQKLTDLRAEAIRLKMEVVAARVETIDPQTKIGWDAAIKAGQGGDDGIATEVRAREDGVARADLGRLAAQIATLVSQKHAKEAQRDKFAANIVAQKALVATTQENLTMIESLLKGGYNSQAKFLDMKAQLDGQQVTQTSYEGSLENAKQAILMIDSEMAKTREIFVTNATQRLSTIGQTVVDMEQQLVKADQTLANMTLHAPVGGIVHASAVTTIGQVVRPGQQLMQVVPREAPLEIQAYVNNTEVGFIRKGDAAMIKLTAFTYNVYGAIDGTVTDIANDTVAMQGKPTTQTSSLDGEYRTTTDAQKTGNYQFAVTVRAARTTMTVEGKEIPLVPGMAVNVQIRTETRRAIDYILSPIEEVFSTAGHER